MHTPHAHLPPQVLCRMATSGWLAWWCSEEGAISRNLGAFVGGYLLWVIATLFVSVGRDCTFAYAELRARVLGGIERLRELRERDPYADFTKRTAFEVLNGVPAPPP